MGQAKKRKTEIEALKASGPPIAFKMLGGADRSDPLVSEFLAVCNEPEMKQVLLGEGAFGRCAKVSKLVWSALNARGSKGWQFVVWRQSGDYHVFLINGDLQCHPAPEKQNRPRMICRAPLHEIAKVFPDVTVDVVDTPDEITVEDDDAAAEPQ